MRWSGLLGHFLSQISKFCETLEASPSCPLQLSSHRPYTMDLGSWEADLPPPDELGPSCPQVSNVTGVCLPPHTPSTSCGWSQNQPQGQSLDPWMTDPVCYQGVHSYREKSLSKRWTFKDTHRTGHAQSGCDYHSGLLKHEDFNWWK